MISAKIAGSFGLRASNKSATRGRPPVISRVFEPSCGIRASTSPGFAVTPSVTSIVVNEGRRVSCKPRSSLSMISLGSFAFTLARSLTTTRVKPVSSSVCASVFESSISLNEIFDLCSRTIGGLCGSQVATMSLP